MTPDNSKVQAVQEWPRPRDATEVRQSIGLTSYYQKYIQHFADIARPLYSLMQNNTKYHWTEEREQAFRNLKTKLMKASILAYPRFDKEASPLILQTDASLTGLGAVLEQDSQVITYASQTLSMSKVNYSVIQRKSLAAVWGTNKFRHYLRGHPLWLLTDHESLKWLAEQKMEGILCWWAIAAGIYLHHRVQKRDIKWKCRCIVHKSRPQETPCSSYSSTDKHVHGRDKVCAATG